MKDDREFHTYRGYQILGYNNKLLTASMEDYLEMIYRVCIDGGYIRTKKLAKLLNVQASSVSKIVQKLSQTGLVDYEKYGIIQLTEKGRDIGEFLLKRHRTVEEFLQRIGVKDAAFRDTEMIEHYISLDSFECIKMMNDFLEMNDDVAERFCVFRETAEKERKRSQ